MSVLDRKSLVAGKKGIGCGMVMATVLRCPPQRFVSYLPVCPYAGIVGRQSAVWRLMSFLDSREQLSPQGIGKSVPRREDARLLMGRGR